MQNGGDQDNDNVGGANLFPSSDPNENPNRPDSSPFSPNQPEQPAAPAKTSAPNQESAPPAAQSQPPGQSQQSASQNPTGFSTQPTNFNYQNSQSEPSDNQPAPDNSANFSDHNDDLARPDSNDNADDLANDQESQPDAIRWTANEAVDHQRGKLWYLILTLVAVVVIGGMIFLKQWTTAGLALVVFVAILIVARRPVRQLHYTLTDAGIYVENQLHPFEEFRAFGVRQDGGLWQLGLIPAKRFGLALTMYIGQDQGEAIVDALGSILPMVESKTGAVDKLAHRLKL
jgi:hypothetical protein